MTGNGIGNHSDRRSCSRRSLRNVALALLILVPPLSEGKMSPLASIPTHHGINASLHINGGGGAVARRNHLKRRHSSAKPRSNDKAARDPRITLSSEEVPSISTSYSVKSAEPLRELPLSMEIDGKKSIAIDDNLETSKSNTVSSSATNNASHKNKQQQDGLTPTAIACMSLLALQFGIQPILVRKFTPQTIVRSSVVLVQELVKFGIAGGIYLSGTHKVKRAKDFEGWSVKTWIALAGLPAFLYTIQNMAALMAYQNLEALTFNVLNQTKILSAALSCYFVMGKRQSKMQVFSLCLLIVSTLVIERILHPSAFMSFMSFGGGGGTTVAFGLQGLAKGVTKAVSSLASASSTGGKRFTHGIVPIMIASLISGLAGALTQLNLQGGASTKPIWGKRRVSKSGPSSPSTSVASRPPRNAYLFSMEMNIASVILLLASLLFSSDGRTIIRSRSFFDEWTPQTFIPVITNAIGGILVGLVTKHAGSVRKGFALIFGLLLSGIFQAGGAGIRSEQIVGGTLAALSLWMHTLYPHKAEAAKK